jgi:uncharacterized membrane protein YgcG
MKKPFLLTLLSLALATFAFADDDGHQSYLSYDDGGTLVKSGDDGREIDAHRNLPIYPGDEVITSRRGRAEVRLSDGNIIGIDRTTAIRFQSIRDAYEGEDEATVAELRYGKVAVHRTDIGRDDVRLDTAGASYVADRESVYSVETDSNGRDRVTVFAGSLEVRTRERTTRLRSGESATVDERGLYDLVGDQRDSADDFERWFLKRADRFDNYNSRYVDRRLGYWADDLDDHGRWVHVTGIGWSWRPYVSAGWRPYYNGYWHHGRGGSLVWVSYDPWAWGTYHYGRWAFDPGFGWFWVPGGGYSPAWVYWTYGPSYVGWAPAGYWDCYRPYYNWAYHPYRNYGVRHGFGFYGRVRVSDFDLRPWTFVAPNTLVSRRVDRAALTADAVKDRMYRAKDGFAPVTGGPNRFTREELRDPAEAIRRRGLDGGSTGRESGAGAPEDMTPFVRRDPQLAGGIRDRVIRARGSAPSTPAAGTTPSRRAGVGSPALPGSGAIDSRRPGSTDGGRIGRGNVDRGDQPAVTAPRAGDTPSASRDWRGRVGGRDADTPRVTSPATGTPGTGDTPRASGRDAWRDRVRDRDSSDRGTTDAPRRIIDGTGGARVVPRDRTPVNRGSVDRGSSRSSGGSSTARESGGSRDRSARSGSGGGNVDRGGRSSGGDSGSARQAPPPPPPQRSSPPPSRSEGSSRGNRGDGGRVQRDQ